ncbi:four helix bundle protein [candidate division KSB1 bacterium]|nr:four helix bundle protein [candidate division KSB1 bacterium]
MKPNEDLRQRTRQFALRVVKLYCALPKTTVAQVLGKQVLRSGTAVGAVYAESCRARSNADFVSKVELAMQELEESRYWLELLVEAGEVTAKKLAALTAEADELMAIFVSMVKRTKAKT